MRFHLFEDIWVIFVFQLCMVNDTLYISYYQMNVQWDDLKLFI